MEGKQSFLSKQYPTTLTGEEKLKYLVETLCADVLKMSNNITDKVKEKYFKESLSDAYKKSHDALDSSLIESSIEMETFIKHEAAKSEIFSHERLQGITVEIIKLIFKNWKTKMESS